MAIRVLLADDHSDFRSSVRRLLENTSEFDVVAEAASGVEAVQLARKHLPDVVVLDVRMKGMTGIAATSCILADCPRTAILMVSICGEKQYVVRSVEAGARGYLLKDTVHEELFKAIRAVYQGGCFFCSQIQPFAKLALGSES